MDPNRPDSLVVREARESDLAAIGTIYNQGIADREATLDEDPKSDEALLEWFALHGGRYAVIVACRGKEIVGWASLNPYSQRSSHRGVADLSVYIERGARRTGVGTVLLGEIEQRARGAGFHKIVLFALDRNEAGKRLYGKFGFRDVGVFKEHGRLDGRFEDVLAMEKLLKWD